MTEAITLAQILQPPDSVEMDVRVEITNADIAAARRAWIFARDGDAEPARVEVLYDDLRRLVGAQAQQIADDFRTAH